MFPRINVPLGMKYPLYVSSCVVACIASVMYIPVRLERAFVKTPTKWNHHVPSEEFCTDCIHIRKGLTIPHGRESLIPDDKIYFCLRFLENVGVHCHSKEKCGYCGQCLSSMRLFRCDSLYRLKPDSPCQIHLIHHRTTLNVSKTDLRGIPLKTHPGTS